MKLNSFYAFSFLPTVTSLPFTKPLKNATMVPGQNLTLSCSARGGSHTRLGLWFKAAGQETRRSVSASVTKFAMDGGFVEHQLTYSTDYSCDRVGQYMCEIYATDSLKNSSNANVHPPPSQPRKLHQKTIPVVAKRLLHKGERWQSLKTSDTVEYFKGIFEILTNYRSTLASLTRPSHARKPC